MMLSDLIPIRQSVAAERVSDVAAEVRAGLAALPLSARVRPGMRIAIAVGSRGIACLFEVVQAVVAELVSLRAEPFIVPAMGSHGGGTAEGQRAVLEGYGIRSNVLGVPIHSAMEVVQIGETADGMPVFMDANAAGADGILLINRIKEHTSFKGRWESGLMKMATVGLGKAQSAAEMHRRGIKDAIPAAAQVVFSNAPIIAGVGIVENGEHHAARIAVLPVERIETEEAQLLELARRMSPRIPFEPLDLLVVREMGKDISGTGMDLNVIGMWRRTGGPVAPDIRVIAVLDLTERSHGNAIGVGHADLITQRLREKIDYPATYKNCLTSGNLAGAKIPITLPTDREVIEAGMSASSAGEARVVVIKNTLELDQMWISPALLEEAQKMSAVQIAGPAAPIAFDSAGNLRLADNVSEEEGQS